MPRIFGPVIAGNVTIRSWIQLEAARLQNQVPGSGDVPAGIGVEGNPNLLQQTRHRLAGVTSKGV